MHATLRLPVYPNASLATLFISEVMEGTSFNKAVEIYNPTRFAVSLDLYTIGSVTNGGDTVEGTSDFPAGAVIESGGVCVASSPYH
jgi:predicted extracellular nuclease